MKVQNKIALVLNDHKYTLHATQPLLGSLATKPPLSQSYQ